MDKAVAVRNVRQAVLVGMHCGSINPSTAYAIPLLSREPDWPTHEGGGVR